MSGAVAFAADSPPSGFTVTLVTSDDTHARFRIDVDASVAPGASTVSFVASLGDAFGSASVAVDVGPAPGALDASFGDGGVVVLPNREWASAVSVAADGRIVVGTETDGVDARVFFLDTDGTFDPASPSGAVVVGMPYLRAVLSLRDGRTLVGGGWGASPPSGPIILRAIAADGTLDPSFAPFQSRKGWVTALAQQDDGAIVANGLVWDCCGWIARFALDGTLDKSFAPAAFDSGRAGVVVDHAGNITASTFAAQFRFLPTGKLDTTFAGVGYAKYGSEGIALDTKGRVLVGNASVLERILPDGTLDPSFPRTGTFFTLYGIAIQPDEKIVAARDNQLRRWNGDGSRDEKFGTSGAIDAGPAAVRADPTLDDQGSVALQPDGMIVVASSKCDASGSCIAAVRRYWP